MLGSATTLPRYSPSCTPKTLAGIVRRERWITSTIGSGCGVHDICSHRELWLHAFRVLDLPPRNERTGAERGTPIGWIRTVILTTERLILREFCADDWTGLHAIESNPEVARYQSFEPRTPAEARAYVQRTMASAQECPRLTYDLAVLLSASNRLVGRCGLQVTQGATHEAMVWYTLDRSLWGQGYIPEALRALVDFGFAQLRLHRIWADCDPANRPSYRVLEKIGMRREGHLRENAWQKGAWVDSLIYAILDREWRS